MHGTLHLADTIKPVVEVVANIQHNSNLLQYPDNILCLTNKSFMIAALSRKDKPCTRELLVEETPFSLLYYEPLNLLIVGCLKSGALNPYAASDQEIEITRRSSYPNQCALKFLDPRT